MQTYAEVICKNVYASLSKVTFIVAHKTRIISTCVQEADVKSPLGVYYHEDVNT